MPRAARRCWRSKPTRPCVCACGGSALARYDTIAPERLRELRGRWARDEAGRVEAFTALTPAIASENVWMTHEAIDFVLVHTAQEAMTPDYLARAADAYRQAIAHYSKVGDYGDVPRNLGASQRRLDQVLERISELDGSEPRETPVKEPPVQQLLPRSADHLTSDTPVARRVPDPR